MRQIKKILFPVDFSDSSVGAARHVEALAGHFEAEIMLLHAVGMGEHTLAEEREPARKAQLDAFLQDELKYFTTHRVCVPAGDPARAIADAVQSWGPDLVMMPTHGLGFFRRQLLGSVTTKTLHDVTCPVWTSVHAESTPPLEEIHCRRILCSVDLRECSGSILQWAAWLAGEYQASLGIVHATAAADALDARWNLREELARYILEQAKIRINALQMEAGTSAEVFIDAGRPGTVVPRAAGTFGADLLVIGRHRSAGLVGDLFQNALSILGGSPCPVISI
ncbi:MAG TPA: universal stress protein [Bryobacteraceae bacterium]